jgi:hypothetical protein
VPRTERRETQYGGNKQEGPVGLGNIREANDVADAIGPKESGEAARDLVPEKWTPS